MKGHIPKKRFGQNFLIDNYVINQIINLIDPQIEDFIVEIGPGLGALTRPLLDRIPHLHVVEIDRDIIAYLKKNLAGKLTIHEIDALKFDFSSLNINQPPLEEKVICHPSVGLDPSCNRKKQKNGFSYQSGMTDKNLVSKENAPAKNNSKIRVIGNLPYNISTPLLFHLAQYKNIHDMHFMLQKEVVDRICAKPNNGDYGRLSIMLQHQFNCTKILDVSATSFDPAPKVESAIVKLIPKPISETINIDKTRLNQVVTAAFNQRRKTIANSLKNIIAVEKLAQLGIDPKKRAENLTVPEYLLLSKGN